MVETRFSTVGSIAMLALAACAKGPAPAPKAIAHADDAARPGVSDERTGDRRQATGDRRLHQGEADAGADAKADANAFTLKLYGALRKTPGNLFVSGTSLRSALGVAYLGARGDTAREMAAALSLPRDASTAAAHAKEESAAWEAARGKAELVVANRVWIEKSLPLDARYAAMAEDAFGAAPSPLELETKPDEARRTINTWVAQKTADKIVDLLPEGAVDSSSRLVVTNAIYFRGRWAYPFTPTDTKDEPFETAPSTSKPVPMMHATDSYAYGETADAKMLELRYEGTDIAMMIVLPKDHAGLAKVEEGLDAATYDAWTKALKRRRVKLAMPKVTMRSGGSMAAPLRDLGMRAAFTKRAEFAGIASEKIQIDQVVQKTFVTVDETGTEAAAASGVVMRTTSLVLGEVAEFTADHPFLFFLHDAKKGTILFAGRCSDPK